MIHRLTRTQELNAPPDRLWHFLSRPENLNLITPSWLNFKIRSHLPEKMYEGLLIEYRVSVPLFGKQKWLTEIRHIRPGRSFVEEQRIGPYRLWYHYHEVQPIGRGRSVMTDEVTYMLPFSYAGEPVHSLIVRRQLEQISEYRKSVLGKIFE